MDKDSRQENFKEDKDGEMTVHQQISEAYQSGVVDRLTEEERSSKKKKE